MINSLVLSELLNKAVANDIDTVFISKKTGEILCIEGKDQNQAISDIVSNMWMDYETIGSEALKGEEINSFLIENEDSNMITTYIYGYILTMKASNKMALGLLKMHLDALANNLRKILAPYQDTLLTRAEK